MSAPSPTRLARAVLAAAGPAVLVAAESRDWLSATFAGRHHRLGLVATADAHRRLAALPPEALRVPGETVVDMAVAAGPADAGRVRLVVDALTVWPC